MALMQCPECGHDVSTLAQSCPNCGYPIQQILVQESRPERTRKCPICKNEAAESVDPCPVCGYIFGPYIETDTTTPTMPRCPTCGSTDITRQGIVGRAVTSAFIGGFAPESRAQFRCNKCGYMW